MVAQRRHRLALQLTTESTPQNETTGEHRSVPGHFGVRKLACAFPEPEQLHTNKGSSKLPRSKETVDYSFGCGWAALCSSVFICGFRSYFWLRLCCAVKLVASFSVYTSEVVSP